MPDTRASLLLGEFERLVCEIPLEDAPVLLGELERIRWKLVLRVEVLARNRENGQGREPLLDSKAAAAILCVPPSWLREAARQGRVRCVRVGHYVRFRRTDLAAFIEGEQTT
jgi:excisionase family DNA binding protein